ncbi:MAG: hypothetical protein HUJ80_03950 [Firmicutes bacterium]|nr:hypothetical protein [Bacillota bacterium]
MSNPHKMPFPAEFHAVLDTVKRVDEKGWFYSVDYDADYYQLQEFANKLAEPGCSTFVSRNLAKEAIMGRNYDYKHFKFNEKAPDTEVTGLCILIKGNNPKAMYRSLALADGFFLDNPHGSIFEGTLDDGKTDISPVALAPFICMDAINEAGLAVSIMALPVESDWEEVPYKAVEELTEEERADVEIFEKPGDIPSRTNPRTKRNAYAVNTADKKTWIARKRFGVKQNDPAKKTVFHTILMRMMTDYCATTDEAVAMAGSVNVITPLPGSDYHVLITDRSGKTVVLEWIDDQLVVLDECCSTNYYLGRGDHFGMGFERKAIVQAAVDKYRFNGMPEDMTMHALALCSQDCRNASDRGFTQWSAIYNLDKLTLKLWLRMDYSKAYEFQLSC